MAAPHVGRHAKHKCSGAEPGACQARGARGGGTMSGRHVSSVRLDVTASRAARPGHAAPGAARLWSHSAPMRARLAARPHAAPPSPCPAIPLHGHADAPQPDCLALSAVNARTHAWLAYGTPSSQPAPQGSLVVEARDCGYHPCMARPVSCFSTVLIHGLLPSQTGVTLLPCAWAQEQNDSRCVHCMRALCCHVQLLPASLLKHTSTAIYAAHLGTLHM